MLVRKLGLEVLLPVLGALMLAQVLAGCGAQVFSDTSALVITGTPPPPPEPPPPPAPKRVEVTDDKIVIHDKIQFEVNKADIKSASHGLLDEIVSVINENPHIKKLSIEGHTDSDGSDKYNRNLSDKRAAAVRAYLTGKGVDEGRLSSVGHGESQPIAENETAAGKEKNRRVEFIITEQDEIKRTFEVDAKTGEKKEIKEAGK